MRFPLFSTVTYLAENEPGAPWLAPTVVMAQTLQEGVMTPESPERSLVAHPEHNHVLVFPGNLSHGVLDSNNKGTTRQTLLVNWWVGERPEAVERISLEQAEANFGSAPSSELEDLGLDEEEPSATKLRIPRTRLPPGGPPAIATVDDLRAAATKRIVKEGTGGEAFGRGVDVMHEGFTLFPMDNDAEENKGFTTLGVFVADESGSDSDSK
jgi:hypothetical protein